MSYCVNCGVELEKSCAECPLCDTPVINPREKFDKDQKPVYPEVVDIPKSTRKNFLVFLITMILLIPNLVLLILNIFILQNNIVNYIVGGFALAWIWFLFPFLWKKQIPVVSLGIDALALLGYSYAVFDEKGWFYPIIMPVVIALWAICNLFIFWLKKPRTKSVIAIAVLGAVSVMSFVVEICINMFNNRGLETVVSLIVTACCASLIIFFAVMEKSKRFKAWMQRKFFM